MGKVMLMDNQIATYFKRIPSIQKWTFISACIIGFITHIFYFSNMFANEDYFIPIGRGLRVGNIFG